MSEEQIDLKENRQAAGGQKEAPDAVGGEQGPKAKLSASNTTLPREVSQGDSPPNDPTTELSVLAACLGNAQALPVALELPADAFYGKTTKHIFAVIRKLADAGTTVDIVTLPQAIRRTGKLTNSGIDDTIDSLLRLVQSEGWSAADIQGHCDLLREMHDNRQLRRAFMAGMDSLRNGTDVRGILDGFDHTTRGIGYANGITLDSCEDAVVNTPPPTWLWDAWLPKGLVVLLGGEPGVGKSALALSIADRILRPKCWPQGEQSQGGGSVVWLDTESSEVLLFDRIRKWDVPTQRLLIPYREDNGNRLPACVGIDDPRTWRVIRRYIEDNKPTMLVVDSLSGSHKRNENSADMRGVLGELATLARDNDTTVLITHHLRKRSKDEAASLTLDRLRGSTAIAQFARVVWGLSRPDPDNPTQTRLAQLKNNVGTYPPPIGVEWNDAGLRFLADAPDYPDAHGRLDEAADFVANALEAGPLASTVLTEQATTAGIATKTLQRAKKLLRVESQRKPHGDGYQWFSSLPSSHDKGEADVF